MPQRKHRLEIPDAPKSDDPVVIQRWLSKLRQTTMDEFNRLATDYYTFKNEVIQSGGIALQAVSNILITNITAYGATFSWTLPVQPQEEPTHVRVRIAEITSEWAELTYPVTSWTTNSLLPSTAYTFEVQLVYRGEVITQFLSAVRNCPSVPVAVESLSEVRSRSFTTSAGIGPPGDGGGGDTDFPVPDTTTCTPGSAGVNGEWQWKVQQLGTDGITWTDTAVTGTANGTGSISVNTSTLDAFGIYRLCIRELCDGVATGDGSYTCGQPFSGNNDWLDDCGGIHVNDSIAASPYSTADLFAIPQACLVDGVGTIMLDAISGAQVYPGEGFSVVLGVIDGADYDWTIFSENTYSGGQTSLPVGWTYLTALQALDNTDSVSVAISVKVGAVPTGLGDVGVGLLNISDRLYLNLYSDGSSTWGVQFIGLKEGGGQIILLSGQDYAEDTWLEITFNLSSTGTKKLAVNGIMVDSEDDASEMFLDGMSGYLELGAWPDMEIQKVYGWSDNLDVSCAAPANLANAPLDEATLEMFFPHLCNGELREYVSQSPFSPGPRYLEYVVDGDDVQVWSDSPGGNVATVAGVDDAVPANGDMAIAVRGVIGKKESRAILSFFDENGEIVVSIGCSPSGPGITLNATFATATASYFLTSATVISLNTEFTAYVTYDYSTGDIAFYVDGVSEDTETAVANDGLYGALKGMQIVLPADSWVTDCAAWSAVVAVPVPGGLYDAMLAAGPLAMWDYSAASGTIDDVTTASTTDDLVTVSGGTYQNWVSPDTVSRLSIAAGKAFTASPASADLDFNPAGGISYIGSFGSLSGGDIFFAEIESTQSSVWQISYQTSSHFYVRYGRSDTGGAWRIWRIAKTTTEMHAVRFLYVFMPGDGTVPTVRADGVAWTLTLFSGPTGTQATDRSGELYMPGSGSSLFNGNLGPAALYAGAVSDIATIEGAASAEGWY